MKTLGITILAIIGLLVVLPVVLGILGVLVGLALKLLALALIVAIPALLVVWIVRACSGPRHYEELAEPEPDYAGPHAGRLRHIDYRLRRLEDILVGIEDRG